MSDGLFDMAPAEPEPSVPVSADRRRTLRQAAAIATGGHPLGVPRHPGTKGLPYSPGHRRDPLTCGSCTFRQLLPGSEGRGPFPKCAFPGRPITHGAGTDVRAWWPACTDYAEGGDA
jgi:hypothetical protein